MSKKSERGAITIIVAGSLMLFIGLMGFVIEFGYMHIQKNRMQNIADAAALACLNIDSEAACGNTVVRNTVSTSSSNCSSLSPCGPLEKTHDSSSPINTINTYGFVVKTKLPVDCNIRDYACASSSVTSSWQPIFLPKMFSTLTATANATAGGKRIGACFIVKDTLSINGSIDVALDSCSASIGKKLVTTNRAGVNIYTNGQLIPTIYQITIYNNGSDGCSAGICTPKPNVIPDPLPPDPPFKFPTTPTGTTAYSGIPAGSPLPNGGVAYTLSPGEYSSGIDLNGTGTCTQSTGSGNNKVCTTYSKVKVGPNDTVTFKPGTYYIVGTLNFSDSGTYTGDGVSFMVSDANPATPATISISGGTVSLKAQAATNCGSNSDVLLFHKPSSTTNTIYVKGSNTINLEGVIFLPADSLSFSGTATKIDIKGTIIANNITTNGNVKNHTSPNNCYNKGTRYKAALVY
jgi:hypothetical protein